MEMIAGYVKTLAFFMIFMALVQIIAPSGSFKKYIGLVLSLVLIALFLEPFGALLSNQSLEGNYFRLRNSADNILLSRERERYEEEQAETVMKEYKKRLNETVRQAAMESTGLTVNDVNVVVNTDYQSDGFAEILGVHLTVLFSENESGTVKKTLLGNSGTQTLGENKKGAVKNIKSCIAGFYNVHEDNIHITVRATCLTDK